MRVLVWQWGRFGAGPRLAVSLAKGLQALPNTEAVLSLAASAEILRGINPPTNDLPVTTYAGLGGFALRVAGTPFSIGGLARRIRLLAPDIGVCAMPGPLDLLMASALRRLRVPFVVLVHDADHHPGDGLPLQMGLQRALCRRAAAIGALSSHVADRLRAQGLTARPMLRLNHPPLSFAVLPPRPRNDGSVRLLFFGRLLPYKGLDLLAETLAALGPRPGLTVRVVGSGSESPVLGTLRALPGVSVENRWVPEAELGTLLAWSDALVLPYREASQSGVAAAALAAGRRVVATRVGGLVEQLEQEPLAILCEPDVQSLAAVLRQLLAAPLSDAPARDAYAAWRDMAASLLRQTVAAGICRNPGGLAP